MWGEQNKNRQSQKLMRVSQILVVTHLLCLPLVRPLVLMVDPREVGDNDGDWEGDHKDSRQGADTSNDLAQASVWDHVAISETNKIVFKRFVLPLRLLKITLIGQIFS